MFTAYFIAYALAGVFTQSMCGAMGKYSCEHENVERFWTFALWPAIVAVILGSQVGRHLK
jgi:hypothetical protein